MGINRTNSRFLLYLKKKYNVSYQETLTLGRQELFISPENLVSDSKEMNVVLTGKISFKYKDYAENYFELLGAEKNDSMDYSNYENATIIHDLNFPIPSDLKNKYSVVYDGGTLEHVFNFPSAIKSCMEMVKVGGHFIASTPANNFCGHGFYQLSPELFFSLFTEKFGFKIKDIMIYADTNGKEIPNWYRITDTHKAKMRVNITNDSPTTLIVVAEKVKEVDIENVIPFQSDYENIWTVHKSLEENTPIEGEHRLIHLYRSLVPDFIKSMVRRLLGRQSSKEIRTEGLGNVDQRFFEKVDISKN